MVKKGGGEEMRASDRKLNISGCGFVFLLLLLIPCAVFAAEGNPVSQAEGVSMSVIYGVIAGISLLLLIGYGVLVKKSGFCCCLPLFFW